MAMREEKLYSTGEAAKLLGISFITIKRWIYAGRIKAIKMPTNDTASPKARSNACWASKSQKTKR